MSLFDNNETAVAKFEDLVGEGKKYKDNDAAAKAIVEKDNFIARLQAEQDELRRELTGRPAPVDRSQEILDRLEALNRREPVTEQPPNPALERTEVKGLSADDFERLLNERERKAQAQANTDKVRDALVKKYGPQYTTALKVIGEKNGLSAKALDDLAAQAPQLVLNLLETVKPDTGFTPPNSSLNPGSFVPETGGPRNKAFYDKLKATDKAKYFSPEVRMQQYKDAMALGEAYHDV